MIGNAVRVAEIATSGAEEDIEDDGKDPAAKGRYNPAVCTGSRKRRFEGKPSEEYISTCYVERMSLNIRMGNRRFTRLTNAFSTKIDNHI